MQAFRSPDPGKGKTTNQMFACSDTARANFLCPGRCRDGGGGRGNDRMSRERGDGS